MSPVLICPKCGRMNDDKRIDCSYCASPLYSTIAKPSPSAVPPPPRPQLSIPRTAPAPAAPASRVVQQKTAEPKGKVKLTMNGLEVIIIGLIIQQAPYISALAWFLILVGAVLVIFNRKIFGEKHSKYTVISPLIFIIGTVVYSITAWLVNTILIPGQAQSGAPITSLVSTFNQFLLLGAVLSAVTGLASLLFTYALQNRRGRYLLWLAWIAGIAVTAAVNMLAMPVPELTRAFTESMQTGTYDPTPVYLIQTRTASLSLFQIIPSLILAWAYYLVVDRIRKGGLP